MNVQMITSALQGSFIFPFGFSRHLVDYMCYGTFGFSKFVQLPENKENGWKLKYNYFYVSFAAPFHKTFRVMPVRLN